MSEIFNDDCMIKIVQKCDIRTKHIFRRIISKHFTKIINGKLLKFTSDYIYINYNNYRPKKKVFIIFAIIYPSKYKTNTRKNIK